MKKLLRIRQRNNPNGLGIQRESCGGRYQLLWLTSIFSFFCYRCGLRFLFGCWSFCVIDGRRGVGAHGRRGNKKVCYHNCTRKIFRKKGPYHRKKEKLIVTRSREEPYHKRRGSLS